MARDTDYKIEKVVLPTAIVISISSLVNIILIVRNCWKRRKTKRTEEKKDDSPDYDKTGKP